MALTLYQTNPLSGVQEQLQVVDNSDKRIRLRARDGEEERLYGQRGNPLAPSTILYETNGIIFPYTPEIRVNQSPRWSSVEFVHSLQDWYYFSSIPSVEISISGTFTAQNRREARYLLGVLHFLRSYSKMEFGEKTDERLRGLPPPTLILEGYGDYMFNSLPVIIRNWDFSLPSNVDYVKVSLEPNANNNDNFASLKASDILIRYVVDKKDITTPTNGRGNAYVPSITTISVSLVVQKSPLKLKKEFSLEDFVNGKLMGDRGKGYI